MALIDKASLLMVPSTYEAGTLYNVLPSGNRAPDSKGGAGYDQTRADFSFDRGSNAAATRVNSNGLIEKYRENLLTESNNFSDSDWNVKAGTFTQGVEDPDGGNNAWAWTATNTDPYLYQSGKSTTGVSTLSIWVKGVGSTIGASFQIRTGAAPYKNLTLTGDWQRVEHFNTNVSGTSVGFEYGNPAVVGDVVHIYQAQYEVGTIATDVLTSGATTAKAGVLIDLPRINYDANGENGALLLEPQRANLVPNSELFDQAYSTYYNFNLSPVVTINYGTSPEGLSNSSRLDTTAANSGWYTDGQSVSSGETYTCSIFAKLVSGSESDIVRFGFSLNGDKLSRYDLSNGTINLADPNTTSSIEDYGNGWYRLIQTITTTSSGTLREVFYSYNDAGDYEIYGLQVEAGSYSTSYIPNHGESGGVTRAADSCSVTGVSDVIGQTEGTIYAEFDAIDVSDSRITISDGTSTNRLIFRIHSNGKIQWEGVQSGADQWNIESSSGTIVSGSTYKIAAAYGTNDVALYVNGTQIGVDNSAVVTSTLNAIKFANASTGTLYYWNQYTKQVALFKERLSNAEIAALTA